MTQYLIIALLWVASLAGVGWFAETDGHASGVTSQKVVDQKQFDAINRQLDAQKAEAGALLKKANADIVAAMAAADSFKTQLERDSETRKAEIDTLRRSYAGRSLRFATSSKAAGCGAGSSGASGAEGAAAGPDGSAVVQLPDQVTADLRQLTVDGDVLKSEYRKCRDYVYR